MSFSFAPHCAAAVFVATKVEVPPSGETAAGLPNRRDPARKNAAQLQPAIINRRENPDRHSELSDNPECPAPTCFGEEIKEDIGKLFQSIRDARLKIFISWRFKRPIDNKGFAQNIIARNKSPKAAVLAVIPVIAHRKILAQGNVIRPIVLANASRINVLSIALLKRFAVDINGAADHLERVAGHPHQPLDISYFRAIGILENYDIPASGRLIGKYRVQQSGLNSIDKLIDEEMVANQKVGFHGSRGNLEGLDHVSSGEQRDNGSDDDGFKIFPNRRFSEFQCVYLRFLK